MKSCYLLILCFIITVALETNAQIDKDFESTRDRFFFGGNVGLSVGTITDIEISPLFGYFITKRWACGMGLTYEFYKYKYLNAELKTNIYGANVFTRIFLFPDLSAYFPINQGISFFSHLEYYGLSLEERIFKNGTAFEFSDKRFLSNNTLVGGGLFRKYGERKGGMYFMVLFLLNDPTETPLSNPEIRIGLVF